MNKIISILILILFTTNLLCQKDEERFKSFKIDTFKAKSLILNLGDLESHKDFWNTIYERDQFYRGANAVDSIDANNLILVSYYFNKYGYPDRNLMGNSSSIIHTVWIHNKYSSIGKLTFPIILQGYLQKEISKNDLKTYFLKNMYHDYFDDDNNKTKSLKELFISLGVNLKNKIDIKKVISEFGFYNVLKTSKIIVGQWKAGNDIVQIFKDLNSKYYFRKLFIDGSYEPKLISIINNNRNTYKFTKKETDNYFKVIDDGSLFYMSINGIILKEYKKY